MPLRCCPASGSSGNQDRAQTDSTTRTRARRQNLRARAARALFLFVLLVVVQLLGDDFQDILSLVGAVSMSWLGCMLPFLFYLRFSRGRSGSGSGRGSGSGGTERKKQFDRNSCDFAIVALAGVLGFLGMVSGTYSSLRKLAGGG